MEVSNNSINAGITLANLVWLPLIIREDEIILTEGPLIAFISEDSYVSYREVKKPELEFVGTSKEPYDFFKSSFSQPADVTECSFIDGFRSMDTKSYYVNNNLEFFIHNSTKDSSVYILSKSKNIVLEVTTKNISNKDVNYIITKAYIR